MLLLAPNLLSTLNMSAVADSIGVFSGCSRSKRAKNSSIDVREFILSSVSSGSSSQSSGISGAFPSADSPGIGASGINLGSSGKRMSSLARRSGVGNLTPGNTSLSSSMFKAEAPMRSRRKAGQHAIMACDTEASSARGLEV